MGVTVGFVISLRWRAGRSRTWEFSRRQWFTKASSLFGGGVQVSALVVFGARSAAGVVCALWGACNGLERDDELLESSRAKREVVRAREGGIFLGDLRPRERLGEPRRSYQAREGRGLRARSSREVLDVDSNHRGSSGLR